ncbi:MAG TPA: hypothetical protein VNJ01_01590 [Bacteriovoracaceae bacterium]|nr:hypothetical protein [Bacteriovoracaceae bacterium]
MKLQELIDKSDLDMTIDQVKSFFLGIFCADKPLSFNQAFEELLIEIEDLDEKMKPELKNLWDELQLNHKAGIKNILSSSSDDREFLETSKDHIDFFLTALTLSGTNTETCKDEDLAELIEELEDNVMDIEDYLADEAAPAETGKELARALKETWSEFLKTKK